MWSLDDLPARTGAEVMNKINEVILNPYFLSVFMFGPLVCVVLLWRGAVLCYNMQPSDGKEKMAAAVLQVAGSVILIVGEFGVTAFINVPLNNELKKIFAGEDGRNRAADFFEKQYTGPWTTWNTVRMFASVLTVLCFAASLRLKC